MRLHDIILESPSAIIYHFTTFNNAISILRNNTIGLSPFIAKQTEQNIIDTNKIFYLSTTRSKLGEYGRNNTFMIAFVLDGNKLKNNFQSKSVDYWGNPKLSEMEDRLLSNNAYIKDANRYITRIDVYASEQYMNSKKYNIQALVQVANSIGIDVKVYTRVQDFNLSKNPLNNDDLMQDSDEVNIPDVKSSMGTYIIPYINALKGVNLEDKGTSELIYKIKNYPYDLLSRLRVDLHNANNSDEVREFARLAKRLNFKTIKEISNFLIKKYVKK